VSLLVECPHCSTRVLPLAGRICPACRKNVDSEPEPAGAPEVAAEAVYGFAAEQLGRGVSTSGIARELADRGLDPETATVVVRRLEQAQSEANRQAGQRNMIIGAIVCCVGVAITALTFRSAANNGGGQIAFAWGAILFGAIQFLRGLSQSAPKDY
jgi:hypothetical protein